MANTRNCPCDEVKVQALTLEEGRPAERHVHVDEAGNEVIEIFAEEKKPLHLEKKIKKEYKQILAKEIHEVIQDGEVVETEVRSIEPETPLQLRERIAVVDHHKLVDGDYVRRSDIAQLVADAVVTGVAALHEQKHHVEMVEEKTPFFSAQSVVEQNVVEKNKNNPYLLAGLVAALVGQAGFLLYWMMG